LEEVRRRTKVIGRFPGEASCLSLCWAVLYLVLVGAPTLALTDLECQHIAKLRQARLEPTAAHILTA
jgi:putative transposase